MTTLISSLRTTIAGYINYRGREGHYSFLLHRLTGLGTLLFLAIHIVDTATVYWIPHLYDHAIAIYRLPIFLVGEMGLVFAVIYHGVNGLRIIYQDMVNPASWTIARQRRAARWTLIVSILVWLPAAFIMLNSLLAHL